MVIDDEHVLLAQRRAARQFIERNLGANDLMAVIFTGGRADAAQEFTSNKRLLLASVDPGTQAALGHLNKTDDYYLDAGTRQSSTTSPGSRTRRELQGPLHPGHPAPGGGRFSMRGRRSRSCS
jgi:hypothetical protein